MNRTQGGRHARRHNVVDGVRAQHANRSFVKPGQAGHMKTRSAVSRGIDYPVKFASDVSTRSNKENVTSFNADALHLLGSLEYLRSDCVPRFEPVDRQHSGHVK